MGTIIQNNEKQLAHYAAVLWQRKFLIALFVVVSIGLGYWGVKQVTPLYTAEAVVALKTRPQTLIDNAAPAAIARPDIASVKTEAESVRSTYLVGQVVDRMNLVADPEFNLAIAEELSLRDRIRLIMNGAYALTSDAFKSVGIELPAPEPDAEVDPRRAVISSIVRQLQVSSAPDAYTIRIQFVSEVPEKAARFVNELVDLYLANQVAENQKEASQAMVWLEQRVNGVRAELDQATQALADFRTKNNLVPVGPQAQLATQRIIALNTELGTLKVARLEAEAQLAQVKQLQASGRTDSMEIVTRNPTIQILRQQEADLAAQVANLSQSLGARHPDLVKLTQQLNQTRRERATEVGKVVQGLESRANEVRARERSAQAEIESLRQEANLSGRGADELAQLQRAADGKALQLEALEQRFKEATSRIDLDQAGARVVTSATAPIEPSHPNKPVFLAVAALGSMLLAMTLAILYDHLTPGFRSAREIKNELGLKMLGAVPKVRLGGQSIADQVLLKPLEPFAEAIRTIITAITHERPAGGRAKLILVTSSIPDEGKTSLAIAAARTLTLSGLRVLLLDCDLRRPSVGAAFRFGNTAGLVECIEKGVNLEEAIRIDEATGLHVMPAGHGIQNPQRFFASSSAVGGALKRLMMNYDFIVIDSPPVMVASDAALIARGCDSVLYAVEWEKTPRSAVKAGIESLTSLDIAIAGVVLTKVDYSKQRYAGDMSAYAYRYKDYHNIPA
ncbi:MAG TPA: polysaccharide biosynthesis tyrosine autokinase [Skermanella sp.]|nr:polysaccharide biosynthesis tyrosine autokinase [Skermanella sp.]